MATIITNNYWANPMIEPKRQYKWLLHLGSLNAKIPGWVVKSASKPNFNMGETAHSFINHTFYYPGKLTWNPLDISLVDPGGATDVTKAMMDAIRSMGYAFPQNDGLLGEHSAGITFSKAAATNQLGTVKLQQFAPNTAPGGNPNKEKVFIETWTLHNAWIKDVNFGSLSYDNEGLVDLSMTLRFDWAVHNPGNSSTIPTL